MKKVLFFLSLAVALWLVIGADWMNVAIDHQSKKQTTGSALIFTIPIAILLTIGYIIFFRKTFPKAWGIQKKRGQIGIAIIILIFCVGITIAGTTTIDLLLPHKKKELLDGRVAFKETKKSSKSRQYFIRIRFTDSGEARDFLVPKKFYERHLMGQSISAWYYTGPFGTQYSRFQGP